MQVRDGQRLYSASDLVTFLECEHATTLAVADLATSIARAPEDEATALLQQMGYAHEAAYLERLEQSNTRLAKIPEQGCPTELYEKSLEAMRQGFDVIFQATLYSPPLYGRADFLRRVPGASLFGDYHYEVIDTKLSRSAKAGHLVQLCFYSKLLASAQGREPQSISLVLGNGKEECFHFGSYSRYFEQALARFLAFAQSTSQETRPERVLHCSRCVWRDHCASQWLADDHLNQVAGITRSQIERLRSAGIHTMAQLGSLGEGGAVSQLQQATIERLRGQAALQLIPRSGGPRSVEVLPLDAAGRRGFARLPMPSDGDIFFDLEGDPFEEGGLEYLIGVQLASGANAKFRAFWAHDRQQERRSFQEFVAFVSERLLAYPDMHLYHYGHYEPTALKRLMSIHGSCEAEIDDLLRQQRFVDLYTVVREGIRTSEAGYSLKDIERFYLPPRGGEVKDAGSSIVQYEKWRASRDEDDLTKILDYNKLDCLSTQMLRDWLLTLRPDGLPWFKSNGSGETGDEEKRARAQEVERELQTYRDGLMAGLPADRDQWSTKERARELLSQLLDFHRRCDKPDWWDLFARRDMSEEDLVDDANCLGALVRTEEPSEDTGGSLIHTLRFPEQETKLRAGKRVTRVDTARPIGTIESLDIEARTVRLRTSKSADVSPPLSLGPEGPLGSDALRTALRRVADSMIIGDLRYRVAKAILNKDLPRLRGREHGRPVAVEADIGEIVQATQALVHSYLLVQGPPGSGKTRTGSRLIVELLKSGQRIGVASHSHKAIHNLLDAVSKEARRQGFEFAGVKKCTRADPETEYPDPFFVNLNVAAEVFSWDAQLVAGTAWLFADERGEESLDYLFVDEAGQVSLANLIAMSTSSRNVVLLGDQMQLSQPVRGLHPGRSGESTLDYLLDGVSTIPTQRGIFLATSYRMHEDVCRFISDAIYNSRLKPEPANQCQALLLQPGAHPALRCSGITFVRVVHEERFQRCPEEAHAVSEILQSLLKQRYRDKESVVRPVGLEDVLVVAPYNSQVNHLRSVLPVGTRVGTIDKFQGQEAPVVLVSMTTSHERNLPRGIAFLYDKNRLNVAISRAQCLAVVLMNPNLLQLRCSTPQEMELVNTLCWLDDYSTAAKASLLP